MARQALVLSVGSTTIGKENFGSPHADVDPVAGATFATLQATFEAALAVCVADGASPTQAHVTAANSAYTAFKAVFAAGVPGTRDILVSYDTTKVTSVSSLRAAFNRLIEAARSIGMGE